MSGTTEDARKARSRTQRIILVNQVVSAQNARTFTILGTTGKAYSVILQPGVKPQCSCPDFSRRKQRCKHIYFCLEQVLKLTNIDKPSFTAEDLSEKVTVAQQTGPAKRKDISSDPCPFCMEEFDSGGQEELMWCSQTCGSNFHQECFLRYVAFSNKAACPMCRSAVLS